MLFCRRIETTFNDRCYQLLVAEKTQRKPNFVFIPVLIAFGFLARLTLIYDIFSSSLDYAKNYKDKHKYRCNPSTVRYHRKSCLLGSDPYK